jgi:hypothetical protein
MFHDGASNGTRGRAPTTQRHTSQGQTPADNPSTQAPTGRGLGRRRLLQLAGAGTTALAATAVGAPGASAVGPRNRPSKGWDKTFPKSPRVRHQKVSFDNRLGINLVADLYIPKRLHSGKAPALVIGHPFGG